MSSLATGGGSSAAAASAHAGCERYLRTDPLVIGMSRRALADKLGHADTTAGIPEARWMRAMTFERLVHNQKFVSKLLTTAVGALGLRRPIAVRRADGHVTVDRTARALEQAHLKVQHEQVATMITGLAVPFVGMEHHAGATPVKPDFAIVAPRFEARTKSPVGSWLIMGDAKDYERIRSRIDDQRMLKGFLQVALGAESVEAWSKIPTGMAVHRSGALAVPQNSFLQPEAIVEQLDDHRREVRARVDERTALLAEHGNAALLDDALAPFVEHLTKTFDPTSCAACSLFNFCRSELRKSSDPEALLVEIGIAREHRAGLAPIVTGIGAVGRVPDSLAAAVRASVSGRAEVTGQKRIDPVGLLGTIDVVLAKSDAAALGVHGLAVRRHQSEGTSTPWTYRVFANPQAPETRAEVMTAVGEMIDAAMADVDAAIVANPTSIHAIHLVMPDSTTGDVLASIADSLAGVEISRLRWARDAEVGRPALTFDGEPASVPPPLSAHARLAVSFLLEDDRARALRLRSPLVDLRTVIARHLVTGGPLPDAGRLDYLVRWAAASSPIEFRDLSDEISDAISTPGARVSNARSDEIHRVGKVGRRAGNPERYEQLVTEELRYKTEIVERAVAVLAAFTASTLRDSYRSLESAAQDVWRGRLHLHANDLVRFSRTSWFWRNNQVDLLDADKKCSDHLAAVGNPQAALEMAMNAGNRALATAVVLSTNPLRIKIASRQLVDGSTVVALMTSGQPCVEHPSVGVKIQKGSIKFSNLNVGALVADADTGADGAFGWNPKIAPTLAVGEHLVVADALWFGKLLTSGHEIKIDRPTLDTTSSPGPNCYDGAYLSSPTEHQWCCRPHEAAEAEWSDELARRRERGELNPQVWPPVVDDDKFDVPADGSPTLLDATDADADGASSSPPVDLTIDDLD